MKTRTSCGLLVLSLAAIASGCVDKPKAGTADAPPVPTAEPAARAEGPAGETFQVKFETTKGNFVVEVHPDWAPHGAQRFRELVETKFFDDCKFFRVVKTPRPFVVQWGIHGDPNVMAKWRDANIPADPVRKSNKRGFITYAMGGAPTTRSTQVFINYGDNSNLDAMGFCPFGEVVQGMDVVEALNGEYGELPSNQQPAIQSQGNAFLNKAFPNLDSITSARIVGGEKGAGSEAETKSSPEKAESDSKGADTPAEK